MAYAAGWKKFEPLWDWIIRARKVAHMLPALEAILAARGRPADGSAAVKLNPARRRPPLKVG